MSDKSTLGMREGWAGEYGSFSASTEFLGLPMKYLFQNEANLGTADKNKQETENMKEKKKRMWTVRW